MSVFVETTPLQDNLAKREQTTIQTIQIAHAAAGQMIAAQVSLGSLPDDQLLAVLNADTETTTDVQVLLDALALAINNLLDAAVADRPGLASSLTNRAPVGYGRAAYDSSLPGFKIAPPPPQS